MIYTVHGYEVVRVKVVGIEADSQEDAIKQYEGVVARDRACASMFNGGPYYGLDEHIVETEYANETAYYLVDEEGDTEHDRSAWYPGSDQFRIFDDDLKRPALKRPSRKD